MRRRPEPRVSRRTFVRALGSSALALAMPRGLRAAASRERALAFVHTHTGESDRVVFWADGAHLPGGLARIDRLLRDHYSGDVRAIDPRLLDLLHALQVELADDSALHVISGYRSPATNAVLAAQSTGVAKSSLHTQGQAIDVRLPGCELSRMRAAALALRRGGVGYYPASNFVHLDVGRVRWW